MAILPYHHHGDDNKSSSLVTPFLLHNGLENGVVVVGNNGDVKTESRYKEGTSSFFKTCFNGLNALSGVGLLSIPYALASGGWLSLILLFLIAASTCFTALLIRWCMEIDPRIRTYPDIGERAFGSVGKGVVSIVMYLELYFVATGFLILEGDNLNNLFPNMEFHYSWIHIGGKEGFVILAALIILPTVWLKDLSVLSYVSATGVLASVVIISAVLWTAAANGIEFQGKGSILNITKMPTAFSLYAFCYCAHPVFPTLYTSMKDRSQFNKVMLVCFLVCTIGYTSMAIVGYLMFGEDVKSQVTLNLPTNQISSKIAIYTTLVNPVTKYALMVLPIISAIEDRLCFNKRPVNLIIRTLLLISTVIMALCVPLFGDLMSLVGSLLSATGSVILPCIFYLKISGTYRRMSFELFGTLSIVVTGILVAIIGTYTSLVKLIEDL